MRSAIKETNVRLRPAEARYLERKLGAVEKLLDPSDSLAAADIEVERTTRHHRSGNIFRAEINLRTESGSFRAEAFAETLQAAIDVMRDEVVRQLVAGKTKARALAKKGAIIAKRGMRDSEA